MNRVHLKNQLWQLESTDTEIDKMVREVTKRKAQSKKRSTTKTAMEKILAFQMEQFNYQTEQDQKSATVLRDTFEQQRKIDVEERQKDLYFFLELGKIFSGNK